MRKDDNGFVIVNPLEVLDPIAQLRVNSTRTVKRRDDLPKIKNLLQFLGFDVVITEKHQDRENLAAKVTVTLEESFKKHCEKSQNRAHALVLALRQSGFHDKKDNVIDVTKFEQRQERQQRRLAPVYT